MAKKVLTEIKLQAPAGQASPAPPVGPALGQHGINIMEFCKAFNAETQELGGVITPVVITVYEDRSFDFVTKSPPAAVLIALGLGEPGRVVVDLPRPGPLAVRQAGGEVEIGGGGQEHQESGDDRAHVPVAVADAQRDEPADQGERHRRQQEDFAGLHGPVPRSAGTTLPACGVYRRPAETRESS